MQDADNCRLLEQMSFRVVLLAMLTRRMPTAWAVADSSVAFRVWHLAPAVGLAAGNSAIGAASGPTPDGRPQPRWPPPGLAGAFLPVADPVRDHLVVPVAVHATPTSLGNLLAWNMLVR